MIQEIKPYVLNNEYKPSPPKSDDYIFIYNDRKMLIHNKNEESKFLKYDEIPINFNLKKDELIYLFSIDETNFYLSFGENLNETEILTNENFSYEDILVKTLTRAISKKNTQDLSKVMKVKWLTFASFTASHLALWYDNNKFCGKCGEKLIHEEKERALSCSKCKLLQYPKISPVIIVGITSGDKILLTKYAKGFNRYALVAGYVEIGETLEEAVKREVMEEVGLNIKNIKYYKSQPWGFSESLFMGFFAEVDGNEKITLDTTELSEATWFHRNDIPDEDSGLSLTWNIIEAFRNNKEK